MSDPDPGKVLADPHHARADLRLAGRAVKARWPVPEKRRAEIAEIVAEAAAGGDIKAAEVVLKMEAQNQADEPLADKNARLDEGKATENIQQVRVVIL